MTLKDQSRKAQMIRVNQAGEYGAVRIYKGQLAVLGKSASAPLLKHMLVQEEQHLKDFNQVMVDHQVRPTALSPLWHMLGFAMGAGSALLGKEAAMACTVAVEEVISDHYKEQEQQLTDPKDAELKKLITKCREEEEEHHDTGLEEGAEQAPIYPILKGAIKATTKLAIALSKRI